MKTKFQLLLTKYLIIPITFSLTYFVIVWGLQGEYKLNVLLITILNTLLIRFNDDYNDYDIDYKQNRIVFPRTILIIGSFVVASISAYLSINYWPILNIAIIIIIIIVMNNFFIKKDFEILKLFIFPSIITYLGINSKIEIIELTITILISFGIAIIYYYFKKAMREKR